MEEDKQKFRKSMKIGRKAVRMTLVNEVFNNQISSKSPNAREEQLTKDDVATIKLIKKKERSVLDKLKQAKTLKGLHAYVPRLPFFKGEGKVLRSMVENYEAISTNPLIFTKNNCNLVIVHDEFMNLKLETSEKKRDKKMKMKLKKRKSIDIDGVGEHDNNIHDVKKIIKLWKSKGEELDIVSAKKFKYICEHILKPFSILHHKRKGVKVSHQQERFLFSVAPYDCKKLRKFRLLARKTAKVESHIFCENKNGNPDVHKLVKESKGNIPLFLDERERNYLRHHKDDLFEKYRKLIKNTAQKKPCQTSIPVPRPPKDHKNWIVCFRQYEDFFEHIESSAHAEKSNSPEAKEKYDQIDSILEMFNAEFHSRYIKKETPSEKCTSEGREKHPIWSMSTTNSTRVPNEVCETTSTPVKKKKTTHATGRKVQNKGSHEIESLEKTPESCEKLQKIEFIDNSYRLEISKDQEDDQEVAQELSDHLLFSHKRVKVEEVDEHNDLVTFYEEERKSKTKSKYIANNVKIEEEVPETQLSPGKVHNLDKKTVTVEVSIEIDLSGWHESQYIICKQANI